jgi:DNA-binding transcriptional MerR regulator
MSELADASGVSAATIKHYLREGLLGADDDIVRTSRNMAYYPPEFVERIRRIKRLQGERFLPLRLIKVLLDEQGGGPLPREEVAERYAMPANVRFRAGGYDEAIGFTVYDTLRYREALQPLVEQEVRVVVERLTGDVDPDAAVEIMRSGREPLRDLIGAMHSKLLLAEFQRRR